MRTVRTFCTSSGAAAAFLPLRRAGQALAWDRCTVFRNRRTENPNPTNPGTFAPQVKGFKISRNRDLGDQNLPLAHTCFFQIELPAYSTLEVPFTTTSSLRTRSLVPMRWKICKEKLLYAIRNCRGFLIA